jgi:hypothetical protein
MAKAQALVARYTGEPIPAGSDFRLTRLFDLTGGADGLEASAQRLLALAGIQPSVTSLAMARRLLGQMAWEIDWAGQADAELAALAQQYSGLLGSQDLSLASPWAPLGVSSLSGGDLDVAGLLESVAGGLPAMVGALPGSLPEGTPPASPSPQPSAPPTSQPSLPPVPPGGGLGGGLDDLFDGERD